METIEKPLYKHDNEDSVFLGNFNNKALYVANDPYIKDDVTLITRNSDKPWDYFTMPFKVVKRLLGNGQLAKNSASDVCYKKYLEYLNKN